MKIKKTNGKNRKILVIIALILVAGLICGGIWWLNSQKPEQKKETSTSKTEEKKVTEEPKSDKNQNTNLNQTTSKNTPSNTDHAEGTVNQETGITNFAIYTTLRTENNTVSISAQISGLLYDDGTGTCVHTLTHSDGTKIDLNSQILESPGNKYCAAVSKNFSELKAGTWSVITNYNNSNQKYKGKSDAQSFTVEK